MTRELRRSMETLTQALEEDKPEQIVVNVTDTSYSARIVSTLISLTFWMGAVLVSHTYAASWLIEFMLVCSALLWTYVTAQMILGKQKPKVFVMDHKQLRAWVDAGCPKDWSAIG